MHDGRIVEARFLAFGCPHLLAAASWLTERLVGFDREQLGAWDWQEAARALAVPPANIARLLTLQDAARDLARNWPGSDRVYGVEFFRSTSEAAADMSISLTPAAADRVRTFLHSRGKGVGLRLGVKKTGCSGFAYVVNYADEIGADDVVFDDAGVKVIVDREACATSTAPRSTSCSRASTRPSSSATPTSRANAAAARASPSNCPSGL